MSGSNKDINAELFNAVKNGKIDKVKSLISDGADVNATDQDGWTPLHSAAKNGHKDVVEFLLSKKADVNATDQDGWTPLHLAAKNHHFNIVEVLLDNGANIGNALTYERNLDLWSQLEKKQAEHCKVSLHLAARLGKLEEVKNLLRKGAEIDAKNDKGQTPFDLAVGEEIKDLLQSVKEANDKLLEAAKSGNIGDIENLLNEEGKAQVNAKDKDGKTPLHLAALSGKKEMAELLLNKEADVNAKDKDGKTPLHLAAENGHKEVVAVLLKVEGISINAVDEDGSTPFDLAGTEEIETLQTEEHSSSFFGSLFSILMKPFSLIASFFGGFFSWLFGSNEEKSDEFTTDALLKLDPSDKEKTDLQPNEDHLLG